jgi:hypothetical protein
MSRNSKLKWKSWLIPALFFLPWLITQFRLPPDYATPQNANVTIAVGEDRSGSGVAIVRGENVFVWTAGHVLADSSDARVIVYGRDENRQKCGRVIYHARAVFKSSSADVALLWLDTRSGRDFPRVEFQSSFPRPGEPLFVVSSPHGGEHDSIIVPGAVSQFGFDVTEWGEKGKVIDMMTAQVFPGSSGGAVYSAETFKIIGIAVATEGGALNFYVPTRAIVGQGVDWAMFPGMLVPCAEELEKMYQGVLYE